MIYQIDGKSSTIYGRGTPLTRAALSRISRTMKSITVRTGSNQKSLPAIGQENAVAAEHVRRETAQRGSLSASMQGITARPRPPRAAASMSVNSRLRRTMRGAAAVLFDPSRARRAGKSAVVAQHVMTGELARVGRRRMPPQIGIGRIKRPSRIAELARNEVLVGDRANPDGKFGLALLEIERLASAQELELDGGKLLLEARQVAAQENVEAGGAGEADIAACGN